MLCDGQNNRGLVSFSKLFWDPLSPKKWLDFRILSVCRTFYRSNALIEFNQISCGHILALSQHFYYHYFNFIDNLKLEGSRHKKIIKLRFSHNFLLRSKISFYKFCEYIASKSLNKTYPKVWKTLPPLEKYSFVSHQKSIISRGSTDFILMWRLISQNLC